MGIKNTPEDWNIRYLGDLIIHQKGFAFKSKDYCEEGRRVIRISDTTSNSIGSSSYVFVSEVMAESFDAHTLRERDVILTTVGSRPPLFDSMVGKAIRVPKSEDGSLLNQNMVKISPKNGLVNHDYLYLNLKNKRFINYISTLVRGNANQVSITLNELFKFPIALPSMEEQEKIAKILSAWDEAIEKLEKLIVAKKKRKKGLMQQLLTGKKRFAGFDGEWEEMTLQDACQKITDGAHTSPKSVTEGFPILSVKDMSRNNFNISDAREISQVDFDNLVKQGCRPEVGDVLIAKDGSILKYIFSLKEKIEAVLLSSIAIIRPNTDIVNSEFLSQYFKRDSFRFFVKRALTSGSGVPRIILRDFKSIKISVPSIEEQLQISKLLSCCDTEINDLYRKKERFVVQKRGLMQQLL